MKQSDFLEIYLITEEDKKALIKRVSQDISWDQDELINTEDDVSNTELEDQDETDLF